MTTLKGENIDFSGTPLNEGGLVASVEVDHKNILAKLPNWDLSKHWKTTTEPLAAPACCAEAYMKNRWLNIKRSWSDVHVIFFFSFFFWKLGGDLLSTQTWPTEQDCDQHGYHNGSWFTLLHSYMHHSSILCETACSQGIVGKRWTLPCLLLSPSQESRGTLMWKSLERRNSGVRHLLPPS